MTLTNNLPLIIEIFSFLMLLLAFSISTAKTVRQMIPLYKVQSFILAGITFLVAVEQDPEAGTLPHLIVMPFLIIPILLAISIEPLLAQATVPVDIPLQDRIQHLFSKEVIAATRQKATPTWLEHRPAGRTQALSLGFNLILIVVAYVIAFVFIGDLTQANSLAVSIALLLLGLSTLSTKQDIISQIMGLLVMEHGLFLAAVKVIAAPSVAIIFVISLFLYIIVTLTILVFLLPELHRTSGSIEIEDQQQLKG